MHKLVPFLIILSSTIYAQTPINPNDIQIARDPWGTPHIFGKTDADVAFGLAWANAEDGFKEMQDAILMGKAMMGRVKGVEGAKFDFFVKSIGAQDTVLKYYHLLSPEYLRYLDGYCQGINAYAKAHPKEVALKKAFPVKPLDVLQTYTALGAALSGFPGPLGKVMTGEYDKKEMAKGSNAYAVAPDKTADGKTYLCGNPHFMLDGNFSFFEAHLCSEEGLNIAGAMFQGAHSVALGCNTHLGWSHTYNYYDGTDVWKLSMNPRKKNQYWYDGQWRTLEKKTVKLKVKLLGVVLPVKKKVWRSVYGPTFQAPKGGGFYAINSLTLSQYGNGEQGYEMNKARNFDEFYKALSKQQLSLFNVVYADREGNIFYLCNGVPPVRPEGYDFTGIVPGDTSATRWQGAYRLDELPQALNPPCGYVFNTNNSPYLSACDRACVKNHLPPSFDLRPGSNNRAIRLQEQLDEPGPLTYETFKKMKFDDVMSKDCPLWRSLGALWALKLPEGDTLAPLVERIRRWDQHASPDNTDATVAALTIGYIFEKNGYGDDVLVSGLTITVEEILEGLRYARKFLMSRYGNLDVPLREVFKFYKNGTAYETIGFPDALTATYFKTDPKTQEHKATYGDSYIFFARYGKQPLEYMESLVPYGNSVGSKEYQSQLDLYRKQATKIVPFSKEDVLKTAVRVYAPK